MYCCVRCNVFTLVHELDSYKIFELELELEYTPKDVY